MPEETELDKLRRQNQTMLSIFKEIMENGAWFCSAYEIDGLSDGEDIGERIEQALSDAGVQWERK